MDIYENILLLIIMKTKNLIQEKQIELDEISFSDYKKNILKNKNIFFNIEMSESIYNNILKSNEQIQQEIICLLCNYFITFRKNIDIKTANYILEKSISEIKSQFLYNKSFANKLILNYINNIDRKPTYDIKCKNKTNENEIQTINDLLREKLKNLFNIYETAGYNPEASGFFIAKAILNQEELIIDDQIKMELAFLKKRIIYLFKLLQSELYIYLINNKKQEFIIREKFKLEYTTINIRNFAKALAIYFRLDLHNKGKELYDDIPKEEVDKIKQMNPLSLIDISLKRKK